MACHYIVMADILQSRSYEGEQLLAAFRRLVASCNKDLSAGILSPYTVTLGDEFQGVAGSLLWSMRTVLYLEEARLLGEAPFTLRYVVCLGEISTPLNPEASYGMLGSGLAEARERLNDKRRGTSRFRVDLADRELASQLRRLLEVMSSLCRDWKPADAGLISDLLSNEDNAEVAAEHGKNRSQIWKRRRNLRVEDYKALRGILLELSAERTR